MYLISYAKFRIVILSICLSFYIYKFEEKNYLYIKLWNLKTSSYPSFLQIHQSIKNYPSTFSSTQLSICSSIHPSICQLPSIHIYPYFLSVYSKNVKNTYKKLFWSLLAYIAKILSHSAKNKNLEWTKFWLFFL